MFKIEDIKEGYLLKLSGFRGEDYALVTSLDNGCLCYIGNLYHAYVDSFTLNLVRRITGDVQIEAVYGRRDHSWQLTGMMLPLGRELLWERKEPKEMTVAEIEKALGYPVKIVKD